MSDGETRYRITDKGRLAVALLNHFPTLDLEIAGEVADTIQSMGFVRNPVLDERNQDDV